MLGHKPALPNPAIGLRWLRLFEEKIILLGIRCGSKKTAYVETVRLASTPTSKTKGFIDLLNSLYLLSTVKWLFRRRARVLASNGGEEEAFGTLFDQAPCRLRIEFVATRWSRPSPSRRRKRPARRWRVRGLTATGGNSPVLEGRRSHFGLQIGFSRRRRFGRALYLCSQTAVHNFGLTGKQILFQKLCLVTEKTREKKRIGRLNLSTLYLSVPEETVDVTFRGKKKHNNWKFWTFFFFLSSNVSVYAN